MSMSVYNLKGHNNSTNSIGTQGNYQAYAAKQFVTLQFATASNSKASIKQASTVRNSLVGSKKSKKISWQSPR